MQVLLSQVVAPLSHAPSPGLWRIKGGNLHTPAPLPTPDHSRLQILAGNPGAKDAEIVLLLYCRG